MPCSSAKAERTERALLYPLNLKISRILCFRSRPPFPSPPHAKAFDALSKFLLDTTIDDLEWKNSIELGENLKTKMADGGHFVKI